jgi:predicted ATPase/adenylate cyclase class IV
MAKDIITGGPSTGKTTLLSTLYNLHGKHHVPESARARMEYEQEQERTTPGYVGILPQNDLARFEKVLMWDQLRAEHEADQTHGKDYFLDRGLPDILAYCELFNAPVPEGLYKHIAEADYGKVYLVEPIPGGYRKDAQRTEDEALGKKIHEALYRTYDRLGFDIIRVPYYEGTLEHSVAKRLEHILGGDRAKDREREAKYPAHANIADKLESASVEYVGTTRLTDHYYDAGGVLGKLGYSVRLRKGDGYELTVKGPNKDRDIKDRFERNWQLPYAIGQILSLLPAAVRTTKTRSQYTPIYDPSTKILLDNADVGQFVEIEAPSKRQVLAWRDRLDITAEPAKSYRELAA